MSLIDYNNWLYDLQYAYSEGYKYCKVCEGETQPSACCGATFAFPGYPDNDICSECKEHSEPFECENCAGEPEKSLEYEEIIELIADMKADEADRLYDEMRER
jgi:hypothetical protein